MYVCMYVCTDFTPTNIVCQVLSQIILHIIILIISHLSAFVIILKYDFTNFIVVHNYGLQCLCKALHKKDVLESNRLCKDTSCKCEKYTIYRKISLHNIL